MQKRNLKKYRKLMKFYLMQIKKPHTIVLVMLLLNKELVMVVLVDLVDLVLKMLIWVIFLVLSLEGEEVAKEILVQDVVKIA